MASDFIDRLSTLTRRRLLITSLAVFVIGAGKSPAQPVPRVLFVCRYGTVKSAIARELFRRRARERGVAAIAFSRGITPEVHVSAGLRARLLADGIDPTRDPVRTLAASDIGAVDIVVAFDPLPGEVGPVRPRDWSALPSVNDAYLAARVDLDRRIDALLDEIARKKRE